MSISTELLNRAVPPAARDLCRRLHDAGHRSWLVGGCVRDRLLATLDPSHLDGKAETDWDIATDALPERVMELFRRVIPTGLKHGTVTVLLGGQSYEVTTLRGETRYSDGRHPDSVYFVEDIKDDLARRDFTINAIAYDPLEDRLIDPFSGLSDLKARTLRAVGTAADRFAEDGLRVLRAARFVATLEVELEAETARAITPSLDSYRRVSAERVRDEWQKAMLARRPSRAFEVMREHGLLAITAPELLESVGCEQNRYHAYDVWQHALVCLDHCPKNVSLRVAGLLHDIGKPRTRGVGDTGDYTFYEHERVGAEMADPLLERLRFSNDERARIVALVRHHLIPYDSSWSDAAVRRWLKRVTPELVDELYLLCDADIRAKGLDPSEHLGRLAALQEHVRRVREAGAVFSLRELCIGGADLKKELGLAPGPMFGTILKQLLEEVLEDPQRNTREQLLARARVLADAERNGAAGQSGA